MTSKVHIFEKATNFCEISIVDLSYVVTVKSTVEILQNFVAFSEYMNFKQVPFSLLELKVFDLVSKILCSEIKQRCL